MGGRPKGPEQMDTASSWEGKGKDFYISASDMGLDLANFERTKLGHGVERHS